MNVISLLEQLRQKNITLSLKGNGQLNISGSKKLLDVELLGKIKEHKNSITDYLKERSFSITKTSPEVSISISPDQKRLWFLDKLGFQKAYNIILVYRIEGELCLEALTRSVDLLFKEQNTLRLRIKEIDNELPTIYFESYTEGNLKISNTQEPDLEKSLQRIYNDEFSLHKSPLSSFELIHLSPTLNYLTIKLHHMVSDGWSNALICKKISFNYSKYIQNIEPVIELPEIDYKDYAAWQNQKFVYSESYQLEFWKGKLMGSSFLLDFPKDFAFPEFQNFTSRVESFTFEPDEQEYLRNISKICDLTLFQTAFALFSILVHRYSQQDDFLLGTVVANRPDSRLENLLGFFVNTVIVRLNFNENITFTELGHYLKEYFVEIFEFTECPFERLVEELNPPRNHGHSPLIQILVAENYQTVDSFHLPKTSITRHLNSDVNTEFEIALFITCGEKVSVRLEYNSALFAPASIQRIINSFRKLCKQAAQNLEAPVSSYDIVPDSDIEQLNTWNATEEFYEARPVHTFIEENAIKLKDKPAIYFNSDSISYKELNDRADIIASCLNELEISKQSVIGLYSSRTPEMIIALLAIIKIGGIYVPLDPGYPEDRLRYIAEHSEMKYIISDSKIDFIQNCRRIPINSRPDKFEKVNRSISANDLCYILYTSGSSGNPKGVAVEHKNVAALLHWCKKEFSDLEFSKVLASTSINFDISVLEIWLTLCRGGSLTLCDNILDLGGNIGTDNLTLIQAVPSAVKALINDSSLPSSVKTLIIGGEYSSQQFIDEVYTKTNVEKVFDCYGPTEDTVYSTFSLRAFQGQANIGKPIQNTRAYILDKYRNRLPVGIPGTLHLAGDGLAREYFNSNELTSKRFLTSSFIAESRIYDTGDKALISTDGTYRYLGRNDRQIKLRGFRIELDEINSAINSFHSVKEALTIFSEENQTIAAYIVWSEVKTNELKAFLEKKLPHYMLPSHYIQLKKIPQTANGKISYKELPPITFDEKEYIAPQTDCEKFIAVLWANLLGIEKVGILDDFFKLGGHSLLSLKVISAIREKYSREISLNVLFRYSTLKELAKAVEEQSHVNTSIFHFAPATQKGKTTIIWSGALYMTRILENLYGKERDIISIGSCFEEEFNLKTKDLINEVSTDAHKFINSHIRNKRCVVVGFSANAVIAYQCATLLSASGITITAILLLDPSTIEGECTAKRIIMKDIYEITFGRISASSKKFKIPYNLKRLKKVFKKNKNKRILYDHLNSSRKIRPEALNCRVILFSMMSKSKTKTAIWKDYIPHLESVKLPAQEHGQVIRGENFDIWHQYLKEILHTADHE